MDYAQVIDRIVRCPRNSRYVQPTTALGKHINSHAVTADDWLRLYRHLQQGHGSFHHTVELRTVYQSSSVALLVTHQHPSGTMRKQYQVAFRNDHFGLGEGSGLEFVGENVFPVTGESFPVQLQYNHERQSVVHVFRGPALRIELDALLDNINTHAERTSTQVMDDIYRLSEEAFSLSFRMYIEQKATVEEVRRGIMHLQPPKTVLAVPSS